MTLTVPTVYAVTAALPAMLRPGSTKSLGMGDAVLLGPGADRASTAISANSAMELGWSDEV